MKNLMAVLRKVTGTELTEKSIRKYEKGFELKHGGNKVSYRIEGDSDNKRFISEVEANFEKKGYDHIIKVLRIFNNKGLLTEITATSIKTNRYTPLIKNDLLKDYLLPKIETKTFLYNPAGKLFGKRVKENKK